VKTQSNTGIFILLILVLAYFVYNDMPEKGTIANKPLTAPEDYNPPVDINRPIDQSNIGKSVGEEKKKTAAEEANERGISEWQLMCVQKAAAYETAAASRDQDNPKFIARMSLEAIRFLTSQHINYIVALVYNDPQFASIRGPDLRIIMLARCLDGEDIAPD
jgi:hypothetical protein